MPEFITVRRPGHAFGTQRIPLTRRQRLTAKAFAGIVRNMRAAGWTDMRIRAVLHVKQLPAAQALNAPASIWSADMHAKFREAAE